MINDFYFGHFSFLLCKYIYSSLIISLSFFLTVTWLILTMQEAKKKKKEPSPTKERAPPPQKPKSPSPPPPPSPKPPPKQAKMPPVVCLTSVWTRNSLRSNIVLIMACTCPILCNFVYFDPVCLNCFNDLNVYLVFFNIDVPCIFIYMSTKSLILYSCSLISNQKKKKHPLKLM